MTPATKFLVAAILAAVFLFPAGASFAQPGTAPCPLPNDPVVLLTAIWPLVDTNGDGGISWEELVAIVPLTSDEYQYFVMLDANHDGLISMAELQPILPLLPALIGTDDLISLVDTNGDGVLQYAEVSDYATQAQFDALDLNDNGVLDCEDVGETPPVEGEGEGEGASVYCPLPNDPVALLTAVWPLIDVNGDGGISWAELVAIVPLSSDEYQYFAMLDTNPRRLDFDGGTAAFLAVAAGIDWHG